MHTCLESSHPKSEKAMLEKSNVILGCFLFAFVAFNNDAY